MMGNYSIKVGMCTHINLSIVIGTWGPQNRGYPYSHDTGTAMAVLVFEGEKNGVASILTYVGVITAVME